MEILFQMIISVAMIFIVKRTLMRIGLKSFLNIDFTHGGNLNKW